MLKTLYHLCSSNSDNFILKDTELTKISTIYYPSTELTWSQHFPSKPTIFGSVKPMPWVWVFWGVGIYQPTPAPTSAPIPTCACNLQPAHVCKPVAFPRQRTPRLFSF